MLAEVWHGDRVLAISGNSSDLIAKYFAIGELGAVYVPVGIGFREREGTFVPRNAASRLAVVGTSAQ
jgi:acyl-CoA synthetase (AMP-forming)/AMP-acid ligase II